MSADEFSVDAARDAASRDQLGAWVASFLASPGSDNAELAEVLASTHSWWVGPVELPIDQLHRLAGPPGEPVLQTVEAHEWRDDVDDLARALERGEQAPPVIVTYRDERLSLEDGNHRVEALRRAGRTDAFAIVGFDDERQLDRFLARLAG